MPADLGMQNSCYRYFAALCLGMSLLILPAAASFSQEISDPSRRGENPTAVQVENNVSQFAVRIAPSPIRRAAAAGHVVHYVCTISNQGDMGDSYHLSVHDNLWPAALLSADSSTKITSTGAVAAGGQFTVVVQLEVPDHAGRGVRDSMFVSVISAADAGVQDAALIATTSLGPAAELPFTETFPTNTLNATRWLENFGPATVTTDALGETSPPYALKLDGANNGGDLLQSQPIDLSHRNDVVLQFAYERGGDGNLPEPADDMFIEYYNRDGEWLPLLRLLGSGPAMTSFAFESVLLPRDACHSSFRMRFGNFATPGPFDDWYVDDLRLLAIAPGRLPFADNFSDPRLDPNQWPQNTGGQVNARALNMPSAPAALNLPGGSVVQSVPLDLSAENAVSLSYFVEQTGSGEEPDAGDDLIFEFRDVHHTWIELARHLGSTGGLPFFTRQEVVLPPAAYHADFCLRVRNVGAYGRDDWFLDDLSLQVFAPSDIEVMPTSLALKLFAGDSASRTLTINNLGTGDLFYHVRVAPPQFQSAAANAVVYPKTYYAARLAKGQNDWRLGVPQLQGRGGPDKFGYVWRDSNDPEGPVFAWQDISVIGTRLPDVGDDDNVGPFALGFAFPFYDSVFTQFRVCSNGFLSFTSHSNAFSNNPIPSPGLSDFIAAFWDDLDARSGAVYYFSDGQRLIVQWQNVIRAGGSAPFTFQILLTPDGNMRLQYLQAGTPSNFATIGIQNHEGSDGVEVAFNTNYVRDRLAVELQRPASWLSYSPKGGMLHAGGSANLAVQFNTAHLKSDSTYVAELHLESNDLDEPSVAVQVRLEVLTAGDSTTYYPPIVKTALHYVIRIDHATINGEPLATGDEIGVFTPAGRLAGSVVWRRNAVARLIAYGDDPNTPKLDGFASGETMFFRVWDSSRNHRDYPAAPTFIQGDGSFGAGDSALVSMLAAQTEFTRSRPLSGNWSWISFNVQPEDPSMEAVFGGTAALQIVKNGAGQAFIPALVNTIGALDVLEGYSAYLSAPDSVSISGEEVAPFTPIPLQVGWNFVSYLPSANIPAPQALQTILDKLEIAKNDAGQFLIPGVGDLNTIGDLRPGAGYKVYLTAADTLRYPLGASAAGLHKQKVALAAASPRHFAGVPRSSENFIIVVQTASVNNQALRPGDEIGIYSEAGTLVGAGAWPERGALGIAAWRAEAKISETAASSAGYAPGTRIRFRIWRREEAVELEAEAKFSRGDGTFEHGAFALVELSAGVVPQTFALQQSYPNPFAVNERGASAGAQTTIAYALPEAQQVSIHVYNMLGQLVQTLREERQEPGFYAVQWNGLDQRGNRVAAGVYFYRMHAGKFQAVRKLIVL